MRHLFVPACVCLMTWSGATGSDPKMSRDAFAGAPKLEKRADSQEPPAEAGRADAVRADIPMDVSAAEIAQETPSAEPHVAADSQTFDNQAIDPRNVPLPPIAKPVVHRTREEVCETLTKAAESNNLPIPFFISLLFQESRFDPASVSSAGAQGVAQFMPETAASMGLENPFDPLQAIPASARLLRELVSQFGNVGLAAAAYNAGPKRIQDWLQKKGKLPEETKGYVKTITGNPAETWTAASALPGHRLPRRAPCQESAGLYAWTGPATIPLPARSPLRAPPAPEKTLVAANDKAKPSKHRIAAVERTAAKVATAEHTKTKPVVVASADDAVPAAPAITVAKHGGRVSAVINIAKPEPKADVKPAAKAEAKPATAKHEKTTKTAATPAAKPATQQLAARKQKNDKHKFEKVAAR
jgi:hypothetical protein